MSVERPERLWQMSRVAKGDYLLLSNDKRTLWRIWSYVEDGSATDVLGRRIVGTFWECSYYRDGVPDERELVDDVLDARRWHPWATMLRTRREAVDEAMRGRPG